MMTPGKDWRQGAVVLATLVLLTVVAGAFWWQDGQYALPTPRPAGLRQLPLGAPVRAAGVPARGRPVLLHFFNPDCPCSRFNLEHVRALVHQYGGQVDVVAVLQGAGAEALRQAYRRTGLAAPAVIDQDNRLAQEIGVYSTPQAVVLDAQGRLYYRGNYNKSRYCTDRETEFARLALAAAVRGEAPPRFGGPVEVAYGCPLPKRQRQEAR